MLGLSDSVHHGSCEQLFIVFQETLQAPWLAQTSHSAADALLGASCCYRRHGHSSAGFGRSRTRLVLARGPLAKRLQTPRRQVDLHRCAGDVSCLLTYSRLCKDSPDHSLSCRSVETGDRQVCMQTQVQCSIISISNKLLEGGGRVNIF